MLKPQFFNQYILADVIAMVADVIATYFADYVLIMEDDVIAPCL